MKRMLRAAAWLILIGMLALAPFFAASLCAERTDYVRQHYSSWTGVLRLWKCEGWQAGSGTLSAWLTMCIEKFEKRHPGVYVQMTDVSGDAMREFSGGSANPPDMILYPPGLLDAPYSLMEIEAELPVREEIAILGCWQGARYAVPVALGGYALAINSRMLPQTPENWASQSLLQTGELLDAPMDGEYINWSAALISLFAGGSLRQGNTQTERIGEGIDLGLTGAEPAETQTPEHMEEWQVNALPVQLAEGFRQTESVYTRFTRGEIAAMPVTQREVRRLQQQAETGKIPDWRVEAIGLPFTDQAALVSVTACGRTDGKERQTLCMELIHLMLSGEMQSKLTVSRAFPVIDMPALYQNQTGMREIERALNEDNLLTPPAFGGEWREYADQLLNDIGAGGETQEAYERLRQMMGQE